MHSTPRAVRSLRELRQRSRTLRGARSDALRVQNCPLGDLRRGFRTPLRAKNGTPLKAGRVEYILYQHDVLAENDEQSTDADWELISIHAIPEGMERLPMGPVTMMRNQLELKGGTKAHYSSEEWAEAVRFWQNYAALKVSE